ncbi:hypothetical protein BDN72DRAFT_877549 [Pluteus cervinus]|uniref:Uncharacterized protein n=1 Tax=Pluteus cervinus TaxID=181527 RepID=A0ACD3AYX7_9AGAR|nr:hypothetical protein BDN72DRAFT_877549 [Pluteus cervinus]
MAREISEKVDSTMRKLEDTDLPCLQWLTDECFSPQKGGWNEVTNATSISRSYEANIARYCLPLASSWLLHPRYGHYDRIFLFNRLWDETIPNEKLRSDLGVFSLSISDDPDRTAQIMATIPRKMSADIREISQKNLALLFFTGLSPEAQSAVRDMSRLAGSFKPLFIRTSGHPPRNGRLEQSIPLDSLHRPCNISEELLVDVHPPDRNMQSDDSVGSIYPNGLRGREFSAEDLIQHGWTQAVSHDATFIVFNSGNYERIGIRHRKSQTLFLSDLIHVPSCTNPTYGKLHLGLYLWVLQDALDRLCRKRESLDRVPLMVQPSLGKRPRDTSLEARRNTRQKLDAAGAKLSNKAASSDEKSFWKLLGQKTLGLLYLQYKGYNSQTPTVCRRVRPPLSLQGIGVEDPGNAPPYTVSESLDLILEAPFSCSAIGTLHTGKVSIRTSNDTYLEREVVVKLGTSPKERRRMRSEYDVYHKLWSKPVRRGILPIYGLFEDYNDLATLLVMGKGGISLGQRRRDLQAQSTGDSEEDKSKTRPLVSPQEREMFVSILNACHKAHVCHMDIQPENFLVNSEGEGFIIDFERAYITVQSGCHKIEMDQFKAFLDGRPYDNKFSHLQAGSDNEEDE